MDEHFIKLKGGSLLYCLNFHCEHFQIIEKFGQNTTGNTKGNTTMNTFNIHHLLYKLQTFYHIYLYLDPSPFSSSLTHLKYVADNMTSLHFTSN